MRAIKALAAAALVGLVLTACVDASKHGAVGETLTVDVRNSEIDASAEITVTGVEQHAVRDLAEQISLPDSLSGGTVFLLKYDVQITEGEYPADETYAFGEYNWIATGADDVEISPVPAFSEVEIGGCQLFSKDTAASLAAGEQVSPCMVFVSAEADASIESVNYGKAAFSLRGTKTGWTWHFD